MFDDEKLRRYNTDDRYADLDDEGGAPDVSDRYRPVGSRTAQAAMATRAVNGTRKRVGR